MCFWVEVELEWKSVVGVNLTEGPERSLACGSERLLGEAQVCCKLV